MVGDNGPGYIYIYIYVSRKTRLIPVSFSCLAGQLLASRHFDSRARDRGELHARVLAITISRRYPGEGRGGGIGWIIHEGRLIRRGWIKIEKRTYFKYELSWLEERWGRVKRGISKLSGGENSICTRLIRRYFWNIGNNNNSKDERFFFHPIFPYDFSISDRRNYYLLNNDTFKWK